MRLLSKSQWQFFVEIEKPILTLIRTLKGARIAKPILRKSEAGGLTRTETNGRDAKPQENTLARVSWAIPSTRDRTMRWEKDYKWCFGNWVCSCRGVEVGLSPTAGAGINSKCIKDLNVEPETVKLLEENEASRPRVWQ